MSWPEGLRRGRENDEMFGLRIAKLSAMCELWKELRKQIVRSRERHS
jgi:hypothetical protein